MIQAVRDNLGAFYAAMHDEGPDAPTASMRWEKERQALRLERQLRCLWARGRLAELTEDAPAAVACFSTCKTLCISKRGGFLTGSNSYTSAFD